MTLTLPPLQELHLGDLRATAEGEAIGATERGPFRLGWHAPGIARLRIGTSTAPDYGIVAAAAEPPAVEVRVEGGALRLDAGGHGLSVVPEMFAVSLTRGGETLLGPPRDAHFRRRFRLPRFATTSRGLFLALDLTEGEPVYGHGEKWGRLDHRSQHLTSWDEDALGVNAEISYKNCPFAWSPRGWGLFVHSTARVVHGVGFAPWSHRSYGLLVEDEALDLFLVAADDPAGVLERWTWLTGRPAAVPRWSLGCWLSKAYHKDEGELVASAAKVRELGLPMDVITLDGRAWQDTATRFAFEWDRSRYPEPRRAVAGVKAQDLRLCAWEYPLVSIHNPVHARLARNGWLLKDARTGDPWRHEWDPAPFGSVLTALPTSGLLDFTHPDAYAWWRDQHDALFDDGIDVMKTDFSEQVPDDAACVAHNGERGPRLHNIYPLLYNRCVHEASARRFGTGLVFARAGWAGSHRVPVQWGGDPQSDWGGLAASIRGMLSWSCSGSPWYATDIGGFYGDAPDAELFHRWCQAAVFASHMRFHGIGDREPWSFGAETLALVRASLELRYALIPYIEASLAQARATGLPLARPMALAYPHAREAWAFDTQYLFGPDLLVCPIVTPGGRVSAWLPEGAWWDFFTGERHAGARRLDLTLPPERFPLFVRDGAELPLAAPTRSAGAWGDGPIPMAESRRFS